MSQFLFGPASFSDETTLGAEAEIFLTENWVECPWDGVKDRWLEFLDLNIK